MPKPSSRNCGKYKDGLGNMVITELILKEDSTFSLTTPDPVFPYTNNGRWILDGKSVRLNGDLESRKVKIELKESQNDSQNSITIKVNYTIEEYENEELVSSKPFEFDADFKVKWQEEGI